MPQQYFRMANDNIMERNLQRQLEVSEARFRASVENMLDCFAIYKSVRNISGIIDFYIEYVNEKACQSHCLSAVEQIGKKLGELLPVYRKNGLFDEYCRVVETGVTYVNEAFVYSDDDMRVSKIYKIRAAKMNDGVVVTWRDITDRKQVEEALQESQQFIQQIANSIPGIVYLHDLIEQRNIHVNSQINKLLGYSAEQVRSMGVEFTPRVMHPDDFARLPAHFERFKSAGDGEIISFEYRMRHVTGEWRWFHSRDTVFARTEQGLPRQILGTAIDITERKQVEEQLRQSQQFIQQIADTMPGLLYVYDLTEKRNIYINYQISELLGYTQQKIQEMGAELISKLMHPEDLKKLPDGIEQLMSSKDNDVVTFEYRLRHQDGSWRWFYSRDTVFKRTADGVACQIIGTAQDITYRKQTEEKLRRVNERFQLAATAVKCLIYDWDVENNSVERSGELMELCGYSPPEAEPTRDWWKERIHPEDIEQLKNKFTDTLATAERYGVEYRVRNKDDEYLYVFDQGLIIRNNEGYPVRVVGSTIDISDRKLAESEIQRLNRELERRVTELQTLLDVLPMGIAIASDPNCDNIRVNTFLQKMLRLTPDTNASLPRPNADILPYKLLSNGEEIPGAKLPMQLAAASGREILNSELQVVDADGTTFDLLGHAKPLFDEQGLVRGCVGVYVDITLRKQTEAALRQSEERYRYLTEALPQFVWTSDAKGRCNYVNQRWCEYTGLTLEQTFAGGWQTEVFHPDDLQRCNEDWAKTMHGAIFEGEYRFKRAIDGAYRWFLVRGVPEKDRLGRIVKWYGTSTDIEEQKQIQTERDRLLSIEQTSRAEAEAANRAKDDFVAMVSHDLRAPLNSILGWAQLLRTRKFDDAARLRALETIERNAKSQAKLLEDLLDVSRMIQGKLQIHPHRVELRSLVETAIDTAYPPATEKNIRLESSIDASLGTISGDSNRLQQVLANLLTNAIKFTSEGGKIEVKLEKLPIENKNSRSNLQSNYAQITVSDTGQGISPEFLPHVFDRFRQSSSGSKKGGLGLGLAIARHLIELHGGTIQAQSAGIGQGATFTIKLPLSN